jgi:hypothetical protein
MGALAALFTISVVFFSPLKAILLGLESAVVLAKV